jgi:hypothetical protein
MQYKCYRFVTVLSFFGNFHKFFTLFLQYKVYGIELHKLGDSSFEGALIKKAIILSVLRSSSAVEHRNESGRVDLNHRPSLRDALSQMT